MKKNILIATPALNSGGVEVSLLRFIRELSKNKNISITLLLLKKEGIYLNDLSKKVKVLEVEYDNPIYNYNNKKEDIKNYKNIIDKIKFLNIRIKLRTLLEKNDWQSYYKYILKHTLPINGEYDLAIDFHGYGHFITSIIAEKVTAKKKATWIHDEKNEWLDKVNCWFDEFDKVFCVSKSCQDLTLKRYESLSSKLDTFYNLIDYENIRNKSQEQTDINFSNNLLNIVTVGRLEWQKGYDIAIETAKILKEKNIKFCWYVIGGGTLLNKLKTLVTEKKLEENFKLLGIKKNPFAYIKNADLYVQTSRHEGYGLAIAEAKVLGIIPIATNLECIKEQITNEENGFLCNLDANEFATKIIEVQKDKKLIKKVKNNLSKENFDYTYEFKKLYKLMEE